MSLEPSQLRFVEDMVADFQTFIAAKDWSQAAGVIDNLEEQFGLTVNKMEDELEAARLAE